MGNCRKRKKGLTVKQPNDALGNTGCHREAREVAPATFSQAVTPCAPYFLRAWSEAPGAGFAEGPMSVTAAGVQPEMHSGCAIKAEGPGN